ncbi:hypothetical protein [Clostridium polyendosporum]|uniref:hypothetical protein n=1 Tax=Clostridium polyendosporum TaxID=69208 RepID=UPI001BB3A8D4|nr:hypothetical protein [Clostridium polyendosporum]
MYKAAGTELIPIEFKFILNKSKISILINSDILKKITARKMAEIDLFIDILFIKKFINMYNNTIIIVCTP